MPRLILDLENVKEYKEVIMDLLQNLRFTYSQIEAMDKKAKEYQKKEVQYKLLTGKPNYFSNLFFFLFVINSFYWFWQALLTHKVLDFSNKILIGVAINVALYVFFKIINFTLSMISKIFFDKINQEKKTILEGELKRLNSEYQNIRITLANKTVISQSYWNLFAVNRFITYIANRRADTLKEAINLYEREIQDQKVQEQQQQMANEIERLRSEVSYAQAAAEWASSQVQNQAQHRDFY